MRSAGRIVLAACLLAAPAALAYQTGGYGEPTLLAELADRRITESSGIVASRRTPGVLWTHNDSGDGPYLFATDVRGRALTRFSVSGAENHDWEDIAAGPGTGDNAQLYVGDIGDNNGNRDDTAVYRLWEPAVDTARTGVEAQTMLAERYPYRYPDGHHDAETLLVHPTTGEIVVITKVDSGVSGVYRFPEPLRRNAVTTLEIVGRIVFDNPLVFRRRAVGKLLTGGDISPDGSRVVLRTYTDGFEWTVRRGQSIEDALKGPRRKIALPWFGQFESICYSLDGRTLYTTSEGVPCPLWSIHTR